MEEGSEKWSKPFVPAISTKAINDLRWLFEDGEIILDAEETTLEGIATRCVDVALSRDVIPSKFKPRLKATLLARHHHQHQKIQAKKDSQVKKDNVTPLPEVDHDSDPVMPRSVNILLKEPDLEAR